jgi:hypothetical protein
MAVRQRLALQRAEGTATPSRHTMTRFGARHVDS